MAVRIFNGRVPKYSEIFGNEQFEQWETNSAILEWVRNNEIGRDTVIQTPYGYRKVCYCDYTGSGRSLADIEEYIRKEVLPLYGNAHSSVTVTSEQSALFLEEARDVVRNAVGAGEQDAVLFVGNGATAAVELLVHLLNLTKYVAVVGIQEHHSNMLPWMEHCEEAIMVSETECGDIDISELEKVLENATEKYGGSVPIVGCFTAASNITGIMSNIEQVNALLYKFHVISVWDFASAAPYVNIQMNGGTPKSALFFSGHKFIGGVQTPGVLVVKKHLIKNTVPKRIGGGTVFFVSKTSHSYLKNVEYREEGGTPDIVGAVRLALALKLKAAIGLELIAEKEQQISKRIIDFVNDHKNIILLGAPRIYRRLAVFSFLIRDPGTGLFYHHNYVSALLNDLFGIQSRSGCACAGPYAQYLLGIKEELALKYYRCLLEDARLDRQHLRRNAEYSEMEMLRPGFTRISLPFFASSSTVDFVFKAIAFVAKNARRFITQYQLNCESGEWHHYRQRVFRSRKWLGFVDFTSTGLTARKTGNLNDGQDAPDLSAEELFTLAEQSALEAESSKVKVADGRNVLDEKTEHLRWFLMGSEVNEEASDAGMIAKLPPFQPREFAAVLEETSSEHTEDRDNVYAAQCQKCKDDSAEDMSDTPDDIAEDEATVSISLNDNDDSERKPSKILYDDREVCSSCCFGSRTPVCSAPTVKDGWDKKEWNKRIIVRMRENVTAEEKRNQPWVRPSSEIYKKAVHTLQSFNMIQEGDRILVCLSGGKDSLSLLHILHYYQEKARQHKKTNFHLGAITVDPRSSGYNPRPLIEYCRALNIDYFYEEQDILGEAAKLSKCRSICGYCSRMKRGRLTAAAKLHGYNVLAMGHHLDDLAESFLMSAFQNGSLNTMKAQYTIRKADIRIIRPLIYVREKSLRQFAEKSALPVIAENCPACFEKPKERHRLKQLLASYELIYPQLFSSIRSALYPLMMVDAAQTSAMRRMAIENIVQTYLAREQQREKNGDCDDEI